MKSPALSLCAVLASLSFLGFSPRAHASTAIFDTVTDRAVLYGSPSDATWTQGEQFITGSDILQLTDITLSIGAVLGTPTAHVDLYAQSEVPVDADLVYIDNGSSVTSPISTTDWPDTALCNLYNGSAPAANQLWTIDLVGSPLLLANTKYWIVLSVTGEGSIDWNATPGATPGNLAGAAWNPTQPSGFDNKQVAYDGPVMLQVNAQVVPEPGTVWFSLLGFGVFLAYRRFRLRNAVG